jgi:6-phosphogluconolactonase
MKNYLFLMIVLAFMNCKTSNIDSQEEIPFFVGTYTSGESEGIYKYVIDKNGILKKIGLFAKTNNPSFIAKSNDGKTLVAVDETDVEGTGFVKSYRIDKDSLAYLSTSKSGGAHPCFLNINENNEVLVANYTGGNVGFYKIDNQNGLTNLQAVQQHFGKGTTDRQEAPHAHSAYFHPKKNEIISADLGTNELWFSNFNGSQKSFQFKDQKTLKLEEGAGPRHLAFHPKKNWLYTLNELNNTVSLIIEKNNEYVIQGTFSMLPKDFTGYSKGADIHISADGKFLYASNRGHNSIAIFKIDLAAGSLELIGFESTKGDGPRNFAISPNEDFLIVANEKTSNIVSFKRNAKNGKLSFVSEIKAPNPVCILF